MDRYLPIGSVVLLHGGRKRLMVYGRLQQQEGTESVFDYVGCPYPEGNLDSRQAFLFNHDEIQRVFFIGFQDEEELALAAELSSTPENGEGAQSSERSAV